MKSARTVARVAVLAITLAGSAPARAVEPAEMLANPVLEARARAMSAGLRCLVCQNQSIDDSEAPLAHDLRVLVRERLVAGDSDAQVREYLVARYGPFILLRPPWSAATALLWLTPLACLCLGGIAIAATSGRRRSRANAVALDAAPLDAAEAAALHRLTQAHALPAAPDAVLGSRPDP